MIDYSFTSCSPQQHVTKVYYFAWAIGFHEVPYWVSKQEDCFHGDGDSTSSWSCSYQLIMTSTLTTIGIVLCWWILASRIWVGDGC